MLASIAVNAIVDIKQAKEKLSNNINQLTILHYNFITILNYSLR